MATSENMQTPAGHGGASFGAPLLARKWRWLALAAVVAGIAGLGMYLLVDAYLLSQARKNVRDVLLSHRGVHLYIQRTMHPEFYRARTNDAIALDYYAPEILSSTFMVRRLHEFYNEERGKAGLPPIYYKMAADNPRNPVNRADENERRLLAYFRTHPDAAEYSRVEEIDGVTCLVFAMPFLRNEARCLVCHGTREDAPPGLRARYPEDGGFGEAVGGLRGIESLRVPIEREQLTATVATLASLSGFGVIAILLSFNRILNQTVRQRTQALSSREKTFRRLLDAADAVPFEYSPETDRYTFVGRQYRDLMGPPSSSLRTWKDFEQTVDPEDRDTVLRGCREAARAGQDYDCELRVLGSGGRTRIVRQKVNIVKEDGRPPQMVGFLHDVTGARREASIQKARLAIAENAMSLSLDDLLRQLVDAVESLTGSEVGFFHFIDQDRQTVQFQQWSTRALANARIEGKGVRRPFRLSDMEAGCVRHGSVFICNEPLSAKGDTGLPGGCGPLSRGMLYPIACDGKGVALLGVGNKRGNYDSFDAGLVERFTGIVSEVVFRKIAEEDKSKVEAQLAQAQKVESIGRLAGGVAHDFNNMLQAIHANAALALQDLHPDSPLREHIEEIQKAARRSGDLTRQLLAFARRQTIAPRVLDLNETVVNMLKMLRRLIGEDIHLAWAPGLDLWPVKVDPSQIDQILANLCVNARDAIKGVGKVTIETSNTAFDDAYCQTHGGFVPGDYVRLSVSDNGCGMDKDVLAHLCEPFFTTKEVGARNGLGIGHGVRHRPPETAGFSTSTASPARAPPSRCFFRATRWRRRPAVTRRPNGLRKVGARPSCWWRTNLRCCESVEECSRTLATACWQPPRPVKRSGWRSSTTVRSSC